MSLPALLESIFENDVAKAKTLLAQDSTLANARMEKAVLEPRVAHWLYVSDSVLHAAAAGYRFEIAKLLLNAGAVANAAGKHRGGTPLHYASDGSVGNPNWNPKRQIAMIELLLDAGANIDATDKNGATPLHRAVRTRSSEAVECLLKAGANPTLQNKPGSTPFHLAVQNTGRGGSGSDDARQAQEEIIKTFLNRGVSPKLKDAKGKTVRDWARSEWIRELLN